MVKCQCGYPATPCNKNRHDYLHDCVAANGRPGGLKPQNIVQAAEADFIRVRRNAEEAKHKDHSYEPYAFHRKHVRQADTVRGLLLLALMDPAVAINTSKDNTRMIYQNAPLLVDALRFIGDR